MWLFVRTHLLLASRETCVAQDVAPRPCPSHVPHPGRRPFTRTWAVAPPSRLAPLSHTGDHARSGVQLGHSEVRRRRARDPDTALAHRLRLPRRRRTHLFLPLRGERVVSNGPLPRRHAHDRPRCASTSIGPYPTSPYHRTIYRSASPIGHIAIGRATRDSLARDAPPADAAARGSSVRLQSSDGRTPPRRPPEGPPPPPSPP